LLQSRPQDVFARDRQPRLEGSKSCRSNTYAGCRLKPERTSLRQFSHR
jgi:hypothetical protein